MAYKLGNKTSRFHAIHDPTKARWLEAVGSDYGSMGWKVTYVGWSEDIVSLGRKRMAAERVMDDLERFIQHYLNDCQHRIREAEDMLASASAGSWKHDYARHALESHRREHAGYMEFYDAIPRLVIMEITVETTVSAAAA